MECIEPGRISDDELLAYAEGEAGAGVAAHVARCPRCAAVAATYAQAQRRLAGALYRLDCPSSLALGDYTLGLLAPAARTAVAAHVVDCVRCSEELAGLRRAVGAARPAAGDPSGWRRRVLALFQPPARGLGAAGLRGVDDDGLRVYLADELTIALEVEWDGARRRGAIAGILSADVPGEALVNATAMLYDAEEALVNTTAIDATDTFLLEGLTAGTYRLELLTGERTIGIEGIDVGPGDTP